MTWAAPPEALEARRLLSYTDVSQLAATLPAPSGPTNLYINFDGGTVPIDPANNPNGTAYTIQAFESEPGDTNLNHEQDIQQILYQASEMFAPFNVQVHRIYGAGNYGTDPGATTVFVGGDYKNESGTFPSVTKYAYSETDISEAPSTTHAIHSNAYNVCFVDTVIGTVSAGVIQTSTQRSSITGYTDITTIVQSIAHEAGHTFGLSHVRTDGNTDPTPMAAGTVNDVMSYDSPNQFFADQNLTLTTDNNNGVSTTFSGTLPSYLDTSTGVPGGVVTNFVTQNSYQTLEAVLGDRPTETHAVVADGTTVDATAYANHGGAAGKDALTNESVEGATFSRLGDASVFTFQSLPGTPDLSLKVTAGDGLSPELLLYDASGQRLVKLVEADATGTIQFALPNDGNSYQVVITSHDGNSTGFYNLSVSDTNPYQPPPPAPADFPAPFIAAPPPKKVWKLQASPTIS